MFSILYNQLFQWLYFVCRGCFFGIIHIYPEAQRNTKTLTNISKGKAPCGCHLTKDYQDPKLMWRSMQIYWERARCQHVASFITVSLRNRRVDSAPLQTPPLSRLLPSPDSSLGWTPSRILKLIYNSIGLISDQLCSNLKHDCSITRLDPAPHVTPRRKKSSFILINAFVQQYQATVLTI